MVLLNQYCPIELSVTMEMWFVCAIQFSAVAPSHVWLLSTSLVQAVPRNWTYHCNQFELQ